MVSRADYVFSRAITMPWSGCWIWALSVSSNGYGNAYDPETERVMTAHRLSYLASIGEVPDGMFVCHRCNTKLCVNPDHLYVGTHRENMDDVARGRYHPNRKLSDGVVRHIRDLIQIGVARRQIARTLNLSPRTIALIRDGKTYRYDGHPS